MGLFDSTCAVTGISLAGLDVACVQLPSGPVVMGRSDRAGGIGPSTPVPPFALVARGVFEAIVRSCGSLAQFTASRALAPPSGDGAQHTDGDVVLRHVAAVRAFADLPWMLAALDGCAEEAEREATARLGRDAPSPGWLRAATASFYGAVVAGERRASTSLDGVRADLEFLASYAVTDTLEIDERPIGVLVVQRGVPTLVDVREFLFVVHGGKRAPLSDRTAAQALIDAGEPSYEVDRVGLESALAPLEAPLAADGSLPIIGSTRGSPPVWARADETAYGLTPFARVVAAGWSPPRAEPAPDPAITDDAIEAAIREGRFTSAVLLYKQKTRVGLAEAKAHVEAVAERLKRA